MGWDSIEDIYYKKLIKQISGDINEKDGDLLPEYIIKGKGHTWCYLWEHGLYMGLLGMSLQWLRSWRPY